MAFKRTIYRTHVRTDKLLNSAIEVVTGKLKLDGAPGYFQTHHIPLKEFLDKTGLTLNQHHFVIESDLSYSLNRAQSHPGEWNIEWLYDRRDEIFMALKGTEDRWSQVKGVQLSSTKTGIPSIELNVEQDNHKLFYLTSRLMKRFNLQPDQLKCLIGAYVKPTFAKAGDRSYGGFEFPKDDTYVTQLDVAFITPPAF